MMQDDQIPIAISVPFCQKARNKTVLCKNWEAEGKCQWGLQCKWAHGKEDLQTYKKTVICRNWWAEGSCKYGDRCMFAHGQAEQRSAKQNLTHNTQLYCKATPCKYFMSYGNCVFGSSCRFAHGNTEGRGHGMGDDMTMASRVNHSYSDLKEGTTNQYKTTPSKTYNDSGYGYQNTFRCVACSEFRGQFPSFLTFREVCQHSLRVHRVSQSCQMTSVQAATLLPDKLAMYQCKLCKEIYFSKASVKIHFEKHWDLLVSLWKEYTEVRCRLCEVVIETEGMEEHMDNLHPSDLFADTKDLEKNILYGYEPTSIKSTTSQLKMEKQDTSPSMQTAVAAFNTTAPPTKPLIRVKPISLLQAQPQFQTAATDYIYMNGRSSTTEKLLEPANFRSHEADNKKGGSRHSKRTSPRTSRTSSFRFSRRSSSRNGRKSPSRRSPIRHNRKSPYRNSTRSQIKSSETPGTKYPSKTKWYSYRDRQSGSSREGKVGKKARRRDGERNRRSRSKDGKSGDGIIKNCADSSDGH